MLQQIKFIGSVTLLYGAAIGLVGYLFSPSLLFATPAPQISKKQLSDRPAPHARSIVQSGKPIRITIPEYAIDLIVDEGTYSTDGAWTLSDTHAQFATMTAHANDHAGNTFIYGHATDAVFGKLASRTPSPDTQAQIFTDNNQVFSYKFQESHNLTPDDTSILDDAVSGPPRLTIQTCGGVWNEWRTMFVFAYEKMETKKK